MEELKKWIASNHDKTHAYKSEDQTGNDVLINYRENIKQWCILIPDGELITLKKGGRLDDVDRIKEVSRKLIEVEPIEYQQVLESHNFMKYKISTEFIKISNL